MMVMWMWMMTAMIMTIPIERMRRPTSPFLKKIQDQKRQANCKQISFFCTESLCLLLMQIPSISNGTMTELQTLPRRFWSCGRTWNCTMSYTDVQEVWHPKMVGSQLTRHSNSKCQLPSLRQLPPYRRIIFTGTRTKRNAMNSIAMLTFFASAKTFVES